MASNTSTKVATITGAAKDDLFASLTTGLTEDQRVADLNVLANDPGAARLYSLAQVAGFSAQAFPVAANGTSALGAALSMNADGSVKYDASAVNLDYLGVDGKITDSFTYTVRMANGAVSTATVTVELTGQNDGPAITNAAAAAQGSVKEDVVLTASGQLAASDADHGATLAWSIVGNDTGAYGVLALDAATGQWTYSLDNAASQGLAEGESHTETFTVRVTDDQGAFADQLVSVVVNGTNDAPILGTPAALNDIKANATYTVSKSTLLQGWSDADQDSLSVADFSINHGTVVDNGNDTITITPASNYTGTEVLSYSVTDGIATAPASLEFSVTAAGKVLVTQYPWGQSGDVTAMNTVFGAGQYSLITNYGFNVGAVFNDNNSFVFLEGGASTDLALNNFIHQNSLQILDWVNQGGNLVVESAGWNTSITGLPNTISYNYSTANGSGHLTAEGIAAFDFYNNQGTSFTGNSLSHDIVTGPGTTVFMTGDQNGGAILAGAQYGDGYIMYSGLTDTVFNTADFVLNNVIAYTNAQ